MTSYHLDHLQYLETEAIHVLREVAAEFERPVLLFSGGKDSICILRLAEKAFRPSDIPMPFLNIETGHEFPELLQFRDHRAKELGAKLIVRTVDEVLTKGLAVQAAGETSRNKLQIPALLGAIEEFQFDCAIGGARRDEEKARAKERFFSFRDGFGQWDPKNQRPEIWHLYNARLNPGENMRVFPLSNWTEMDVVEVPDFRALIFWIPLAEAVAETEEAFLGAGLFFVAPCAADGAVELKLFNGAKQRGDLQFVAADFTGGLDG